MLRRVKARSPTKTKLTHHGTHTIFFFGAFLSVLFHPAFVSQRGNVETLYLGTPGQL